MKIFSSQGESGAGMFVESQLLPFSIKRSLSSESSSKAL
jgi:hypothetical protein